MKYIDIYGIKMDILKRLKKNEIYLHDYLDCSILEVINSYYHSNLIDCGYNSHYGKNTIIEYMLTLLYLSRPTYSIRDGWFYGSY
jgi:hypothetical protein